MEVDVDPHVGVVNETESVAGAMSGLNEKIEKLVVELKYMHDENDNLRLRKKLRLPGRSKPSLIRKMKSTVQN